MFDRDILDLAERAVRAAEAAGVQIATAESCTGGLVVGALTAIAGSSAVVDRGFVTYSNAAKTGLLGVPAELIAAQGAVSSQVAEAMAAGAEANSDASLTVAVTGIAGPGGGSAEKPVGLVWFATSRDGVTEAREMRFGAIGRDAVRRESVRVALTLLLGRLEA